jgi:Flp pilus assembly protein TadD
VALQAQQPEQAVRHLLWATAVDDNNERAYTYLGVAYKALQKQPDAISAFERALVLAENQTSRAKIRRYLNELYQAGR